MEKRKVIRDWMGVEMYVIRKGKPSPLIWNRVFVWMAWDNRIASVRKMHWKTTKALPKWKREK